MMKFAVFLLMLVAAVNSNEGEGNILPPGNDGRVNVVVASKDGQDGDLVLASSGDYPVMSRTVMESELDPVTAMEVALPTHMARLSLNVGNICSTCYLLYGVEARLVAVSGAVRFIDIDYFRSGITISAVRINPLGTTASWISLQGGVGTNYAYITITSRVSEGFHYLVEIWGN